MKNIKFKHIETEKIPIMLIFRKKEGGFIKFKATKVVKKEVFRK